MTSGYGSMVELLLAKEGIGVRFPLPAPKIKTSPLGVVFIFLERSKKNRTGTVPALWDALRILGAMQVAGSR